MKIKNYLLASILITSSSVLSYAQTKFSEQKAGHIIYLSLPDYMLKTNTLNDVASMQYFNKVKEAYVVVIEDAKEDLEAGGTKYSSIKEFHDSVIESLKTEDTHAKESKAVEFKQNGNDFYQSDLSAVLKEDDGKEIKVTYLVTYVESSTHFYQILCWSVSKNYKDLVGDFKKIATSIRD